ncbi:SpoIIIAH-like family protein [Lentibacillus sp. L22]|uniref:SpoIIIAH-like family protein n=1 Tax=Lentibacillus TaxID=175304 RepID=UPI0022B0C3F7|nr:SpoIIIAH-like family protein [Lentibacillus daqui]
MLKKQTVWLLTMLSLMIVLSFYYMTSNKTNEVAFLENDKDEQQTNKEVSEEANSGDAKVDDVANVGQDQLFETMRLEVQDQRSKEVTRLEDVVASNAASTEEKNKAYDDIEALEQRSSKESILEESILASADYQDVLVRFDDKDAGKVHVNVITDEMPKDQALNIMQMVRDEFGEVPVDVNYQPQEG